MIPVITVWQRILGWVLWKYEGFRDCDEATKALSDPKWLRCVTLLDSYRYVRMAREWRAEEGGRR